MKLEEDLPRLKESDLAKAARINLQDKHRSRVRWISPWSPKETGKEGVEFLEKVEQCGKWPQQACTSMFFLILSERPIALMPTMIRW